MKYFVTREGREFGPYSLEELQRYTAEGRIAPTDGIRESGPQGRVFASVADVTGPVDAYVTQPPVSAAATSPYAAPATWQSLERSPAGRTATPSNIPMPPAMDWWVLLLLAIATCGIFVLVRIFTQANYAKKVDPENQSTLFYGLYLVCAFGNQALTISGGEKYAVLSIIVSLVAVVLVLIGHFKLKASLEGAFGRPLSGVMTFFFNVFYFQYHMHRVAEAMKAGQPIS